MDISLSPILASGTLALQVPALPAYGRVRRPGLCHAVLLGPLTLRGSLQPNDTSGEVSFGARMRLVVHLAKTPIRHLGVDLSGGDIGVAKQLLYVTQVNLAVQEMRGK